MIPELLQQLDDEMIGFNPAVEIASLKKEEQKQLLRRYGLCTVYAFTVTGAADEKD